MSQQWKNSPDGSDEAQVPLGAGGESPAEDYVASERPRINTSTLALVAAFAAGLIVLYLLGLQNKPRVASAEKLEHDRMVSAKIQAMLGDKNETQSVDGFLSDSKQLVEKLRRYFSDHMQVESLNINPFERDVPRPVETAVLPVQTAQVVIPQDPEAAIEMRQVAEQYSKLKLQMVMLGSPSAALINNRMVTVGTQLELLTVADIKNDSVILTYKDQRFTLKTSGPQMNKP